MPAKTASLEQIEEDLLARSFLYDNPDAYRDGVAAAVDALRHSDVQREMRERPPVTQTDHTGTPPYASRR